MEIKRTNVFRWIYMIFAEYEPRDLCTFFWGLVFRIVSLPVIWPIGLWNLLAPLISEYESKVVGFGPIAIRTITIWLLYFFFGLLGIALFVGDHPISLYEFQWIHVLTLPLLGILAILILVILGGGVALIVGTVESSKWIYAKATNNTPQDLWIVTMYHSIKDKYCPRINWKD